MLLPFQLQYYLHFYIIQMQNMVGMKIIFTTSSLSSVQWKNEKSEEAE